MKKRDEEQDEIRALNDFCKAVPAPTLDDDARRELSRTLAGIRIPSSTGAKVKRAEVFSPAQVAFYIDICLDSLHELYVDRSNAQYTLSIAQRLDSLATHARNTRQAATALLVDYLHDHSQRAVSRDYLLQIIRTMKDIVASTEAERHQLPQVPRGPKVDGARSRFVDRLVIGFIDQFGFVPTPSPGGNFAVFVSLLLERTGDPKYNCAHLVKKSVTGIGRAYAATCR